MTKRTHGLFRWNMYPGGAYFVCDRCSQRWRRKDMRTEWDGLKVCAPCLDPRPPQQWPPNVYPEGIPFPDARPPQDNSDRFMDDTYLQIGDLANPASMPGLVSDGQYPIYPNGQQVTAGAFSPRQMQVDSIPQAAPSASQLTDDISLRTGPIAAPSVLPTDPSPGAVPGPPIPPVPPFADTH